MTNITKAAQDALEVTLYECVACEHLYQHKVSQCDCLENHDNEYREWIAKPKATNSAALQDNAGEVRQFRRVGCADWYDGNPDYEDGRGPYEARTLYAAQPAPVVPDDVALRSRIQDLLHLLSFAKIETPTPTDKPEAEKAMADIRAMIAASQQKGGSAG